jgi:hypothetical protein
MEYLNKLGHNNSYVGKWRWLPTSFYALPFCNMRTHKPKGTLDRSVAQHYSSYKVGVSSGQSFAGGTSGS